MPLHFYHIVGHVIMKNSIFPHKIEKNLGKFKKKSKLCVKTLHNSFVIRPIGSRHQLVDLLYIENSVHLALHVIDASSVKSF